MAQYEVIENFLPKKDFDQLKSELNPHLPWFYYSSVATSNDKINHNSNYYFAHIFYYELAQSQSLNLIVPLINRLNMKALIRAKANLYPSTPKLIEHEAHTDFPYEHKGAVFSINTCDGYTVLDDGTKIASVENRLLLFDPSKDHASSTCTNDKVRMNININYF
tara:strand:- start:670 stop:1161 length:492 start_codon:yes stop_codon:yes gene_type:complete